MRPMIVGTKRMLEELKMLPPKPPTVTVFVVPMVFLQASPGTARESGGPKERIALAEGAKQNNPSGGQMAPSFNALGGGGLMSYTTVSPSSPQKPPN